MSSYTNSRNQHNTGSSEWVSFSGDATISSKRTRSTIPVATYEWPMDEGPSNDIERQQTVVMARKKREDIEVVLSSARAPSSKTKAAPQSRMALPLSRKNTRYQSMDDSMEEETHNVTNFNHNNNETSRVLRMLQRQKREAAERVVVPQQRPDPPIRQFESLPTHQQRHIVSHLQTPPTKYYPKEFPSSSKTWEESDDSDLSTAEESDVGKSRCSKLLKCFLALLAIVLVVSIGFLLGQWIQHKQRAKNSQQVQQQQPGDSMATLPPWADVLDDDIPDFYDNSEWLDNEESTSEKEQKEEQVEPPATEPANESQFFKPVDKPIGTTQENTANNNPIVNFGSDYTANTDYLVGVYYYPWHGANFHNGGGYMRKDLVPQHRPALGEYNDSDPGVIAHHMKWFRQANIGLLVTSWWGPNRVEDSNTKDVIMEHEDVGNLKIALHYETTGRIGKQGEKLPNVRPDIQYMCENYFDHPNYYKVDGRPVLFIYVSRHLHTVGVLEEALLTMRSTASKCGHNLYLIGDSVFESAPDPDTPHSPFWYFDAVTNYDVYGSARRPEGHAGTDAVDAYYQEQADWKAQALRDDCRYIPAVSPGYNDRGVRMEKDHPPLSRRITPSSKEGSLFHYQLKQAKQLVDDEIDKMILVNSFNEWHEDTQIEPVIGDPAFEPFNFTKGLEYVGYGELYLDILGAATSSDERQHKRFDYLF